MKELYSKVGRERGEEIVQSCIIIKVLRTGRLALIIHYSHCRLFRT